MTEVIIAQNKALDKPTYIYGLVDPRTNQIRYVGKTVAEPKHRLFAHISKAKIGGHKVHSSAWLFSLVADGLKPELVILETVPSHGDWIEAEQFWIAYMRFIGANLCNLSIGGEGATGCKPTTEQTAKKVAKTSGVLHYRWGKPMPPQVQEALLEGGRRFRSDPEKVKRLNQKHKEAVTPEAIAKMKAGLAEFKLTDAYAESEARRIAKFQTTEARERVGNQSKEWWATRRDEIIAAQNAGKGEEWKRKQSEAGKLRMANPNHPMRLVSASRRKLSDSDISEIKKLLKSDMLLSTIAARYKVSPSVVSRINTGHNKRVINIT